MEFQILDLDYVVVNEKPVIRIFGKTKGGKSVCGFYENFFPYFYVRGDIEAIKDHATKIEKVKRQDVSTNKVSEFSKITINNPSRTPELRDIVLARGADVMEADILFKYRFMNDLNLKGLGWVKVDGGNGVNTQTVNVDSAFKVEKITPIIKEIESPLKILSHDIECIPTREGEIPDAKRDPIIMLALCFSTPYKGKEDVVLSTRAGGGVQLCDTEKDLLEEFIRIMVDYDADILTGFNCNNFDIPYILERMDKNSVKPAFGRCSSKRVMARKLGMRYRVSIPGRVIVDSFEIVKKDFSLQRYGLDFVSEKLLGMKKDGVKHSEIKNLWLGNDEEYKRLVNYCRKDAILALELVAKLQLLDKYVALSKTAGTLLQDTLEGGETTRIENLLLREFNNEGYVFPCRPLPKDVMKRDVLKKKGFSGGYVIEPEKNLHSNVVVLDFKSMYPSIIRSFNICPTTRDDKGSIKSPSGACFLDKDKRQGIIPRILEDLMNERQRVKRRIKKATDPEKKRILNAKQWALKILANAFYGYLGYSKARVFNVDVANSITSYGRNIIKSTAKDIGDKFGYRVVYGDTDSVFVVIDEEDKDKLANEATKVASAITKELPGIMELEFEKMFKRFLPLTKKRYVAWKFTQEEKDGKAVWEEGIEMKGIETVRRDWCNLVSDTITEVINIVLKKDDIKEAVQLFKKIINDLVGGEIPLQKLVVTKTMTKSPQRYVGMQPHIEVVKKMQLRSPQDTPGVGDRIPYVIVKGTDLLSKRAEDPTYVMDNGLEIDSNYYIENQLMPPLERIFSALEISKSELLGNGRQTGIMDALRPKAVQKPAVDINASEVKGFVCEKCGSFYTHTPLLGVCKCGGRLLFTSQKGQAKTITVN